MAGPPSYKIKRVDFFGRREVPVVLQNENGPCPLLAIANVLLLRNTLQLPSGAPDVSQERLLAVVAERLLDDTAQVWPRPGKPAARPLHNEGSVGAELAAAFRWLQDQHAGLPNAALEANRQQNVSDAISHLPKLTTGMQPPMPGVSVIALVGCQYSCAAGTAMPGAAWGSSGLRSVSYAGLDVNVRFDRGVHGFEYTNEVVVFDLLGISLVHGWLLDSGVAPPSPTHPSRPLAIINPAARDKPLSMVWPSVHTEYRAREGNTGSLLQRGCVLAHQPESQHSATLDVGRAERAVDCCTCCSTSPTSCAAAGAPPPPPSRLPPPRRAVPALFHA